MKSIETLFKEAQTIIANELISCRRVTFDSATGRRLRRVFALNCIDKIGTPFINSIAAIKETEPVNVYS